MTTAMAEYVRELEQRHEREDAIDVLNPITAAAMLKRKLEPVDAVPTPLASWNRVCRDEGGGEGWARGWNVPIAGRTGLGKSVFGLNAANAAVHAGHVVYFASLEMSRTQLYTRFLSIATGTAVRVLEQGRHLDASAHTAAAKKLAEIHERTGGLFLSNRKPIRRLADLRAAIRGAVEEHGARLAIVDYLQLAAADPNDAREITLVSHAVRELAVDLDVTTLSLSQFNRETSKVDTRPSVHGLMGGSAIENDADQVLLIDHSRIKRLPAPLEGWSGFVLLDKNRHGPVVEVPIVFDSCTLRIREQEPDEAPAWAA